MSNHYFGQPQSDQKCCANRVRLWTYITFVSGQSLLSWDLTEVHVHCPTSSLSDVCANTFSWDILLYVLMVTAVGSRVYPARLHALPHHLPVKKQQYGSGGWCVCFSFFCSRSNPGTIHPWSNEVSANSLIDWKQNKLKVPLVPWGVI